MKINYDNLCKENENVIRTYAKISEEIGGFYKTYVLPHIANFNEKDCVISLMGLNPSMDLKERKKYEVNQKFEKIKEENKLDIYYIPLYKELESSFTEIYNNMDDLLVKFANEQYNILCNGDNHVFEKKLKMSWQKYDKNFINTFYNNNEYFEIIQQMKNVYEEEHIEFEDKYLIYTNFIYAQDQTSDNIKNIVENKNNSNVEELRESIKNFFMSQLEFYNLKLTIIANATASNYFMEIVNSKNDWENIFKISPNLYEKDGRYVYLTTRFFDNRRMDKYTKMIFLNDLRTVINYIFN